MSDKITKVRIKQADGTFSTAIPIGVEGANVSLSSGVTLQDTISSINTKLGNEDISNVGTDVTNAINLLKTDVTSKINTADIINDLTHSDTNKPLSAAQGKALNDSKVNIADIINNLTSTATNKPLSAAQGKALNDALSSKISTNSGTGTTNVSNLIYRTNDNALCVYSNGGWHYYSDLSPKTATVVVANSDTMSYIAGQCFLTIINNSWCVLYMTIAIKCTAQRAAGTGIFRLTYGGKSIKFNEPYNLPCTVTGISGMMNCSYLDTSGYRFFSSNATIPANGEFRVTGVSLAQLI